MIIAHPLWATSQETTIAEDTQASDGNLVSA